MKKSEYRDYLASEYWQNRRREFLQDKYGCAECGMPRWLSPIFYDQDLHVDHKNYQHLYAERDSDLQALCPRCHEIKHRGHSKLTEPDIPECQACGCRIWGTECLNCLEDFHTYWQKQAFETIQYLTDELQALRGRG